MPAENIKTGSPEITAAAPVLRLTNQKVLWVEDDPFLSTILAAKLAHEGCVYFHAKNGEEALYIAEHDVPDIILLDLLLPGMTGFDILKAIRANARIAQIPVIVLSNLGQKEDVEKSKELGAVKHLVKAEHDLDDIISEVAKVLKDKAPTTTA